MYGDHLPAELPITLSGDYPHSLYRFMYFLFFSSPFPAFFLCFFPAGASALQPLVVVSIIGGREEFS